MRYLETDMSNNETFNYSAFVSANAGQRVSGIDYIRAIYKTHQISDDFFVWMSRLIWPEIKVIDGHVFVSQLFDSDRFQSLRDSGKSMESIQYWMNLLEITGLFSEMSIQQAHEIAETIASAWNARIHASIGASHPIARVVTDSNGAEIFVTIGDSK
jgi:hypothetical protein